MTTTPHDALFKAAFSKPRHARGLLRSLVPEPLARKIVWSSLRIESGIAVGDEDLDEQRMDLVYSAQAGKRRMLIYVLAEHQSKVDIWMAFRLLCYLVAIWKGYRAEHPRAKKLPAILPIVVHHSPTGWTAPIAFEDMLDADPLAAILRYILETSRTEPATLRELLARQVGPKAAEKIMTTAELLRREGEARGKAQGKIEGRIEGKREGKIEGKREALLLLLRERFGRLPAAAAADINKASAAELDVWFRRGATASSLDEVFVPLTAAPRNKATSPTRATRTTRTQARGAQQRTRG